MPEERTHKVSCTNYTYELEVGFEILSGKWIPLILAHLADGPHRFGQLRRLMPDVTKKMLTQQLRNLEKYSIVHREVYPQVPPVVEYSLTPIGQKLVPILHHVSDWSHEYLQLRDQLGLN
ncbi:winged helix-turn-helix transcriptional regulator [Desulfobaculum bizertense]|uniref:Transcriptional regulator, HxlR family n=1 Tax=Desulfobaculum bizertense DSM 18034 TaxID=1121442 RepID=A0A1T4X418_9BACT|nr:helix-turn-helix domain-containing protein [Desulfobaculum bizertense]UIJ37323.1 helix-turn-helix transcriptional regulator [Desulfobaculum bizertense]SKA83878.1 transcriptional regulator, HxlR family [Desulfobaculum bizertense DSM 18034]